MILAIKDGDVKKALDEYSNEMFPELNEEREKFIEKNKEILEMEAGKEIDLSEYVMIE